MFIIFFGSFFHFGCDKRNATREIKTVANHRPFAFEIYVCINYHCWYEMQKWIRPVIPFLSRYCFCSGCRAGLVACVGTRHTSKIRIKKLATISTIRCSGHISTNEPSIICTRLNRGKNKTFMVASAMMGEQQHSHDRICIAQNDSCAIYDFGIACRYPVLVVVCAALCVFAPYLL